MTISASHNYGILPNKFDIKAKIMRQKVIIMRYVNYDLSGRNHNWGFHIIIIYAVTFSFPPDIVFVNTPIIYMIA